MTSASGAGQGHAGAAARQPRRGMSALEGGVRASLGPARRYSRRRRRWRQRSRCATSRPMPWRNGWPRPAATRAPSRARRDLTQRRRIVRPRRSRAGGRRAAKPRWDGTLVMSLPAALNEEVPPWPPQRLPPPTPRGHGRRWALLGALLGGLLALLLFAPARWLASVLARAAGGQLLLVNRARHGLERRRRGWCSPAEPAAPTRSRCPAALDWKLRPRWRRRWPPRSTCPAAPRSRSTWRAPAPQRPAARLERRPVALAGRAADRLRRALEHAQARRRAATSPRRPSAANGEGRSWRSPAAPPWTPPTSRPACPRCADGQLPPHAGGRHAAQPAADHARRQPAAVAAAASGPVPAAFSRRSQRRAGARRRALPIC